MFKGEEEAVDGDVFLTSDVAISLLARPARAHVELVPV